MNTDSFKYKTTISYKPHIDGLRALAVLSVILYHLNFYLFRSGFVGVDIFFVISGFLITANILKEISNGTFTIKIFYLKRMRRIFPTLLFVIILTTAAAYIILLPEDLFKYLSSAVSTLLYFSNVFFYHFYPSGYFSPRTDVLPLLHTWSLGVEEQFYIVWPFVLLLAARLPIREKVFAFFVLFSISTGLFLHLHSHSLVFYMPFTRAWEFLCGALLCYWNGKVFFPKWLLEILSIIGIAVVALSIMIVSANKYPGFDSILPVLGAAIIIFSGLAAKDQETFPSILKWVFCNPIAIVLGVLSYAAYLIHWPIIAYLNYLGIRFTHHMDVLIIAVTFFLAFIVNKLIEQPLRYGLKISFFKTFLIYSLLPVCIIACFLLANKAGYHGYNKVRNSAEANQYYGILKQSYGCIDGKGGSAVLPDAKLCHIGSDKKKASVLVVGDSHAMAYVGMLNVMLKKSARSAYVVTNSGSPFLLGAGIQSWRNNNPVLRSKRIAALIKHNKYKYVVMAGFWNYYPNIPSNTISDTHHNFLVLQSGLDNAVRFVMSNGAIPVLIYDTPETFNLSRYSGLSKLSRVLNLPAHNPYSSYINSQMRVNNIIGSLKDKYPSVITINPNKVICDNKYCYLSRNGVPFYMSDGFNSHLSYAGSTLIGHLYVNKYGSIFD